MSAEVVAYIAGHNAEVVPAIEVVLDEGDKSHAVFSPAHSDPQISDAVAKEAVDHIGKETEVVLWDVTAPIGFEAERTALRRLQESFGNSGLLGVNKLVLMTDRPQESQAGLLKMIHGLMPQDPQNPQVVFVRTPFDLSDLENALGIAAQTSGDLEPAASLRRMPPSESTN